MNTVNRAYFSRLCGVSKAAITKAVQAGRIGLDSNQKQVNLDHRLTLEFMKEKGVDLKKALKTLNGSEPPPPPKKKKAPPEPSPPEKPARKKPGPVAGAKAKKKIGSPPDDPDGGYHLPDVKSLDDIDETNLFLMAKTDLDKFKIYQQARETKLKVEQIRGTLIKRDIVRLVFSRLYTVDNNELKALEERMSPAICGIFGEAVDSENGVKVRKLINDELTKSLRHIKRIMDDFLVKQGTKKL